MSLCGTLRCLSTKAKAIYLLLFIGPLGVSTRSAKGSILDGLLIWDFWAMGEIHGGCEGYGCSPSLTNRGKDQTFPCKTFPSHRQNSAQCTDSVEALHAWHGIRSHIDSSWGFQPGLKNLIPQVGVKIKHIWNHHLGFVTIGRQWMQKLKREELHFEKLLNVM